jgi:hypothetical protein
VSSPGWSGSGTNLPKRNHFTLMTWGRLWIGHFPIAVLRRALVRGSHATGDVHMFCPSTMARVGGQRLTELHNTSHSVLLVVRYLLCGRRSAESPEPSWCTFSPTHPPSTKFLPSIQVLGQLPSLFPLDVARASLQDPTLPESLLLCTQKGSHCCPLGPCRLGLQHRAVCFQLMTCVLLLHYVTIEIPHPTESQAHQEALVNCYLFVSFARGFWTQWGLVLIGPFQL